MVDVGDALSVAEPIAMIDVAGDRGWRREGVGICCAESKRRDRYLSAVIGARAARREEVGRKGKGEIGILLSLPGNQNHSEVVPPFPPGRPASPAC